MKHRFLLDEMVLYHAVRLVDERGELDSTSEELIRLIGANCHAVVVDRVLLDRFDAHIRKISKEPANQFRMVNFLIEIRFNSQKLMFEPAEAPRLPDGVKVPPEDEHVVRAALISHPIVVTAEARLAKAIKRYHELLGLVTLTPAEALERARDS